MKVKVRRRKPAPIAAEQAKEATIRAEFILDDKVINQRAIEIVQNRVRRIEAIISSKSDNSNKNYRRITDDDIEWYFRKFKLLEIPAESLADCVDSNIFTKENGEKIALVPSLWFWNWITSD